MRAMKDSGVEWIGEIPQDWEVVRIKNVATVESGCYISKDDFVENGNFDVIGSNGKIGKCNKRNIEREVVVTGRVGTIGTARIVKDVWVTDNVLILRTNRNIKELFLSYVIPYFQYSILSSGTAQPLMTGTILKEQYIPLPSLNHQINISDYLRGKCSKIDSIIEKQQAVIEKLKEYKLSAITEAVTKGLNPDVDMKDSGVEWLGKIPVHWSFLPFKAVLKERSEKNVPIKTSERLSLSIDKGVTLYAEKTTNLDRFKDDVSQYKLAYKGDLVLNSMNMIVGAIGTSNYFGCVSPAYYTYYDEEEDHVIARYCDYLLKCKTMRKVLYSLGKGIMAIDRGDDRINTCRLKVSRDDLRSLKIPRPPLCELREIVECLDKIEKKTEQLINKRLIIIDKLKEYKKSLIYEVVTGKKEV